MKIFEKEHPMINVRDNRSTCPISTSLEIVGDNWSLILIRDLFLERTTFTNFINSPENISSNILTVQPSDSANWYDDSYVASKDALKQVQIAYSGSLADRSPAIAEFFANFSLEADDVSSFAYEISGKGRDPAEVAKEWIEANPERVDAWLGL